MSENNSTKDDIEKQEEGEKIIEESENNIKKENKLTPEEKIIDLEDKLTLTYAEMENQRRRYEKQK